MRPTYKNRQKSNSKAFQHNRDLLLTLKHPQYLI